MKFHTIETKRLLLRKLSPSDFTHIFENYSESEIKLFLGLQSQDEFEKEKNKYLHGYTTYNRSIEVFQLLDKTSLAIIGSCGFHNWYFDHNRAELGYMIKDISNRSQGLMTEALQAVIEHGFTKMNLHRIEALVGTENTPSLKLLQKFKFTQEGILRQHYFINNKYEDSAVFSLLKEEYQFNPKMSN